MTKELFFICLLLLATIIVAGFIIFNIILIEHLKTDDEHDRKRFKVYNRNVQIVTTSYVVFIIVLMLLF